jgi:hypothetical protein
MWKLVFVMWVLKAIMFDLSALLTVVTCCCIQKTQHSSAKC